MKKTLTILWLFVTVCAFAQKTKRIEIAKVNSLMIIGSISYGEDNTPKDTTYYFFGKDVRYPSLNEIITLKSGTITDIKDLLTKCLETLNEDDGVSVMYAGSNISVMQMMGVKTIILYGIGDDDDGYCYLSKNWINKLTTRIDLFLSKKD